MPYAKMEDVPAAWRTHKDAPLSLEQINKLAEIYDALKKDGNVENPAAAAWTAWGKVYTLQDGGWIKNEKLASADLENGELKDVEILSVGKWEGQTGLAEFTVADLSNMVENFESGRLPRAPLKLGHPNSRDRGFAQKQGRPAFGWVTGLRKSGEKLLADISNIPVKLLTLIQKKHWIRFSCEVARNLQHRGNTYSNALTALSLLGEQVPAVETLDDIFDLHAANAETYEAGWPEGQVLMLDKKNEEGGQADMEKVEQLEKELKAEKEKTVKLSGDLETSEKTKDELSGKVAEAEKSAKTKAIYLAIDGGIKAMKFPPASREVLAALALKAEGLVEEKHTFSQDEKEVAVDVGDTATLITKLAEAAPAVVKPGETSVETETDDGGEEKVQKDGLTYETGVELDKKVKKVMLEQKIPYDEAFDIVSEAEAQDARAKEEV